MNKPTKKKRVFTGLLALCMLLSIIPIATFTASAAAPDGYTTDTNEKMAYAYTTSNAIDLRGFHEGDWRSSTYSNRGYYAAVKIGDQAPVITSASATPVSVGPNLTLKVTPTFVNKGNQIKLTYTVHNSAAAAQTVSVGATADIQIGTDDRAKIEVFSDNSGFTMISGNSGDKNAQFNFYGKEVFGVDNVDEFWYGNYSKIYEGISTESWSDDKHPYAFAKFDQRETSTSTYDSVMSWSWQDREIPANTEQSFSVLLGIGAANKRPSIENFTIDNASNVPLGGSVPIHGKIIDPDGDVQAASLCYTLNGQAPIDIAGSVIKADGTFDSNLVLPPAFPSGYHTLGVFVIDEGGATSLLTTLPFSIVQETGDELPVFTKQPSTDRPSIGYGETTTISALATGIPTPSYQWQISTDGETTWTNIAGALSETYTTPANLPVGVTKYRCAAINNQYTEYSKPIDITVGKKILTVTPTVTSKYYGASDPAIGYTYSGNKAGEIPAFTGVLSRAAGETLGTYNITAGTLALNDNGNFKKDNYTLSFSQDTVNFTIGEYNPNETAALSGTAGLSGWYFSDVTISAPTGFLISTSDSLDASNTWAASVVTNKTGVNTFSYYLKSKDNGAISTKKTIETKIDKDTPTGEISITTNSWAKFLNTITFGLFFNETQTVNISGDDATSGVNTIGYYVMETENKDEITVTEEQAKQFSYTGSSSFDITDEGNFIVFAKITDHTGHEFYLNSEGLVLDKSKPTITTDYAKGDKSITFTVTDAVTDIVEAKYTVDGGAEQTATLTNDKFTISSLSDGSYPIVVTAADRSGNSETFTQTVTSRHTVTYMVNGETYGTVTTADYGSKIISPSSPSVGGKIFDSWRTDSASGAVWDFQKDTLVKNMILYASFTDKQTPTVAVSQNNVVYGTAVSPAVDTNSAGTKQILYKQAVEDDTKYTESKPENVGTYTVKVIVAEDANYVAGEATNTFKITPKPLTIQNLQVDNKVYDGNTGATIKAGVTLGGIVGTDPVTLVNGTPSFADKNAETGKAISFTAFTLTGEKSGNYTITQPAGITADITKRPITVAPKSGQSKEYGDTDTELTYTITSGSLVAGDALTGSLSRTAGETAGSYEISAGALANSNYAITATSGVMFNITKATLTVTAGDKTINFGQDAPEFTVSYIGFKNAETESALSVKPTAACKETAVGTYDIVPSGGKSDNYDFDYVKGTYTIKAVVATAEDYTVAAASGEDGWLTGDIIITPVAPYTKIFDGKGWADSLILNTDIADGAAIIKLKKDDGSQCELMTYNYKLDKTAPITEQITITEKAVNDSQFARFLNTISFGLFFNKEIKVDIQTTDNLSGVKTVYYQFVAEGAALSENWLVYDANNMPTKDEAFKGTVFVKVLDNAGNMSDTKSSDGFVMDKTAPVITGIIDKNVYYTDQKVDAVDDYMKTLTVDGVETNLISGNVDKTYTIVATDKAGNSLTYTVVMKEIESIAQSIASLDAEHVTSEDKDAIELVKANATLVDITNASDTQKAELLAITDNCDALLNKIEKVAEEMTAVSEKLGKTTAENAKSSDSERLAEVKTEIERLLATDNLTEAEKKALQDKLGVTDTAVTEIKKVAKEMTAVSEKLGKTTAENVKSSDSERLAEVKTEIERLLATDNLTEAEKKALQDKLGVTDTAVTEIKKVAKEMTAVSEKLGTTTAENAKSSDSERLAEVKAEIERLLATDNLTEAEKKALQDKLGVTDTAVTEIKKVAEEMTAVSEKLGKTTAENVKSSDIKRLSQLLTEIEQLLATDNLTVDERKALQDKFAITQNASVAYGKITKKMIAIEEIITELKSGVKTSDKEMVERWILEASKLLESQNLTEQEIQTVMQEKETLEKLEIQIKVIDADIVAIKEIAAEITRENVTTADKAILEETITSIDELLNTQNLTDLEREELKQIKIELAELIKIIDEVTAVEKLIIALPKSITQNDKDAVRMAKSAYDKLTEKQKNMVTPALVQKLQDALDALNKKDVTQAPTQNPSDPSPDTGDNNPPITAYAIFMAALLAAVTTASKKKKGSQAEK